MVFHNRSIQFREWSNGVAEYWSNGKNIFQISTLQHSIAPTLLVLPFHLVSEVEDPGLSGVGAH